VKLDPRQARALRDTVLFIVGLAGVIHETFSNPSHDRPGLLALFGAMMGLVIYLRNGNPH